MTFFCIVYCILLENKIKQMGLWMYNSKILKNFKYFQLHFWNKAPPFVSGATWVPLSPTHPLGGAAQKYFSSIWQHWVYVRTSVPI